MSKSKAVEFYKPGSILYVDGRVSTIVVQKLKYYVNADKLEKKLKRQFKEEGKPKRRRKRDVKEEYKEHARVQHHVLMSKHAQTIVEA